MPIGVYLQPGANALEVAADGAARRWSASRKRFPEGLRYDIPFDTTRFVEVSIEEVIITFVEAIVLVVLVVFLFLQNLRATLIPVLAVPVSIVGTFAGMYLLGFSINLLTLFGLVLAIGIVVDDAIVVLENVERIMATEGKAPREAAIQAMQEVSGPVVAIVLVLCAVFVPVSFLGGLAGELYRQFAVTIAVSVVISGIVALTLTPALCALLLKPAHRQPLAAVPPLQPRLRLADRALHRRRRLLPAPRCRSACWLSSSMLGADLVACSSACPAALVPDEDQGYVFLVTMLPPPPSLDRTPRDHQRGDRRRAARTRRSPTSSPSRASTSCRGAQKTNAGVSFVTLKDWSERTDPPRMTRATSRRPSPRLNASFRDGIVIGFNPPPIQGISTTGGFELYLQDRSGGSLESLAEAAQQRGAGRQPAARAARRAARPSTPACRSTASMSIATRRKALGVPIDTIFDTMQSTFGSLYVNDFTLFGRTYRVSLSSEADFRESPDDLRHVFVRSDERRHGAAQRAGLASTRIVGPDTVDRFNVFPAAKIIGSPAPGFSSGQAIAAMQEVVAQTAVRGLSRSAGPARPTRSSPTAGTGIQGFLFGLVMVFLILAAQYERWSLPLAVLTAVPFAVFGAIARDLAARPRRTTSISRSGSSR